MSSSSRAQAQSLSLLSDLTDNLDTLPHDLTKSFGDLRELDAVLRASMQTITTKIYSLIDLMHAPNSSATASARLRLLLDIAEDAQRLRMGSDDKIKVVARTADDVVAHNTQNHAILSLLASLDPAFTPALHVQQTTFPHVAPSNLILPPLDSSLYTVNGRRRNRERTGNNNGGGGFGIGVGGRGAMLAGLNGAPAMPVTASSQNGKKRRLEDVDNESVVRRTPVKGKDKDADASKEKERPKAKKPKTTATTQHQHRSPSPPAPAPHSRTSTRQHQHQHNNIDRAPPPGSTSQNDPHARPSYHQEGSLHNGNGHASASSTHHSHPHQRSRTLEGHAPQQPQQQQQHNTHQLHRHHSQQQQPHPSQDPLLSYHHASSSHQQQQHPSQYQPQQHQVGPPPSNQHQSGGYTYYPARTHATSSNPINGNLNNSNGSADNGRRGPHKPSGTSSLLDVVANRPTNSVSELVGNSSRGGAAEPTGALFDEDDYDYDSSRRPERGRTLNANANVARNANGNDGRALPDVRHGEGGVTVGGAGDAASGGTNNAGQQDEVYCYCRQVSYGEMIACDDTNCEYEWFHLGCLKISAPPKEKKWFCDECRGRQQRERPERHERKKSSKTNTTSHATSNTTHANGRSTSANAGQQATGSTAMTSGTSRGGGGNGTGAASSTSGRTSANGGNISGGGGTGPIAAPAGPILNRRGSGSG
ncbi:hypothetical protein FRB97_006606 [Tulasnella sp. 331]|nr:hypothetical protein FRB97_006606 [Tulasnella sp. 331]